MQASDLRAWRRPFALLDRCGGWSADLSLRLFLAWEFFESGWEKWNGENWFGDIQSAFPFPFDRLPAAFNWELSLWAELLGALFLLLGLGTRLTALVLIVGAALLLWSRPAAQAKLEALDLDDGGHATLAEPGEKPRSRVVVIAAPEQQLNDAQMLNLAHDSAARVIQYFPPENGDCRAQQSRLEAVIARLGGKPNLVASIGP